MGLNFSKINSNATAVMPRTERPAGAKAQYKDLPVVLFPDGLAKAKLKYASATDKDGNCRVTKAGKKKLLLIWEVQDDKGRPLTTIFDTLFDDDTNHITTRKIGHLITVVGFKPAKDTFELTELSDHLQDWTTTIFNVQFKKSKDGDSMEVSPFADGHIYLPEGADAAEFPLQDVDGTEDAASAAAEPAPEPAEDDFVEEDDDELADAIDEMSDDDLSSDEF